MPRVLLPPKDLKAAALREALLKPEACKLASNGGSIELPAEIVDLLLSALDAWCRGHGVTVTVQTRLLTTQQAAELIGSSRQHVVSLMDSAVCRVIALERTAELGLQTFLALSRKTKNGEIRL